MNLKHLLIFLFIFKSGGICFCQDTPGNLYLIDKLMDESFLSLDNKLTVLGKDKFYEIDIEQSSPEAIYLLYKLRQNFSDYKFTINEKFDTTNYIISIRNISVKPFYSETKSNNISGNKLTGREIKVKYEYEILEAKNNEVLYKDKILKSSKDKFETNNKEQIEDIRYTFTQGNLPAENDVNSYVYPAIIVAVSAVAIILFFTIRSN